MAELILRESSASEAAFIAGVDERDINRLVDEELLPTALLASAKGRRFGTFECVLGSFYFHESASLTKDARKRVMIELAARMERAIEKLGTRGTQDVPILDWSVALDAVTLVNVKSLAEEAARRAAALARAESLVASDEEILAGDPVFAGTRIPVRTVAAWVEAGETAESIKTSFPRASDEMIEAAPLWARTHPARGRPKSFGELNPEWKKVSSRRVKLEDL